MAVFTEKPRRDGQIANVPFRYRLGKPDSVPSGAAQSGAEPAIALKWVRLTCRSRSVSLTQLRHSVDYFLQNGP
jgi:hypothetical protein